MEHTLATNKRRYIRCFMKPYVPPHRRRTRKKVKTIRIKSDHGTWSFSKIKLEVGVNVMRERIYFEFDFTNKKSKKKENFWECYLNWTRNWNVFIL